MNENNPTEDNGFRVLVVDDNRDAANTFSYLLRRWGYDVHTAYDGLAGYEAAANLEPDCLFLDIGMPGMDGYELARRIRAQPRLRGAKLIALTAYSGADHSRWAREAGFDYHLVKPADLKLIEGLLKMLKEVLDLASRTEKLGQQNVQLAQQTRDLLGEATEQLQGVKEEIKEMKEEIQGVKEEIKEIRETLDRDRD